MAQRTPSQLEFALLGLVRQHQPCSGYDLRKIFTHTPMGSFSDSPGAIYPALKRLEAGGLIQGHVEGSRGLRQRKRYRLSPRGNGVLRQWLAQPVERVDVISGMAELSLRFAFIEGVLGLQACARFLESYIVAVQDYIPALDAHLEAHAANMPLSGRLALQGGIMSYRSQLAWARMALKAYQKDRRSQ